MACCSLHTREVALLRTIGVAVKRSVILVAMCLAAIAALSVGASSTADQQARSSTRDATRSTTLDTADVPIPAAVPVGSATELGYNMQNDFASPAADAAAVASGAKIVRMQASWSAVENYSTGADALPPGYDAALHYFGQHGVKVIAVCAYGPPYAQIASVTVSSNVSAGSYNIPVNSTAGIQTPTDFAQDSDGSQMTAAWNYPGDYIARASGNTITLASALTKNLSAGTTIDINRDKYAPLATSSQTDPSLIAYFHYLKFVANQMAADGAQGWVSIWNEDPWQNDLWDGRGMLYQNPPAGILGESLLNPFLQYAVGITNLPAGIRIINDASDETGSAGILWQAGGPQAEPPVPVTSTTVSKNVDYDSIHPYGGTYDMPDATLWDPNAPNSQGCPTGTPCSYTLLNPSEDANSNFTLMAYLDQHSGTGLGVIATEDGADGATGNGLSNDSQQAVWYTRAVATMWGMSVPPVMFDLADSGSNRDVMRDNNGTYTARQAYTALQRMTSAVDALTPGGSASEVPTFLGYPFGQQWPPYATAVYGQNGVVLLVWQRVGKDSNHLWDNIPAPKPYAMEFSVPNGMTVKSATDVETGQSVTASMNGSTLTLPSVGQDVEAITLGAPQSTSREPAVRATLSLRPLRVQAGQQRARLRPRRVRVRHHRAARATKRRIRRARR